MNKKETAKEFIIRLKSLSDPNITNKKTIQAFGERLKKKVWPKIGKQDILWAKSAGRAFIKIIS